MSIGGFNEAATIPTGLWEAWRNAAQETLDAWQQGIETRVTGVTAHDLQEVIAFCETQLDLIGRGKPVRKFWVPVRETIRVLQEADLENFLEQNPDILDRAGEVLT